jgi:hypothetical protein
MAYNSGRHTIPTSDIGIAAADSRSIRISLSESIWESSLDSASLTMIMSPSSSHTCHLPQVQQNVKGEVKTFNGIVAFLLNPRVLQMVSIIVHEGWFERKNIHGMNSDLGGNYHHSGSGSCFIHFQP